MVKDKLGASHVHPEPFCSVVDPFCQSIFKGFSDFLNVSDDKDPKEAKEPLSVVKDELGASHVHPEPFCSVVEMLCQSIFKVFSDFFNVSDDKDPKEAKEPLSVVKDELGASHVHPEPFCSVVDLFCQSIFKVFSDLLNVSGDKDPKGAKEALSLAKDELGAS